MHGSPNAKSLRAIAVNALRALLGLAAVNLCCLPAAASSWPRATPQAVRDMADWVRRNQDNDALPFVIVDKPAAKVFVFDKDGKLLGSAWALVGLAPGDDSVPGIGTMPLAAITPKMRTTPAGRFVASLGHDLGTRDVLWVDYTDAISLHRVINTNPAERRLERIVSPKPAEHRISYGCINVPAKFFDSVVDPAFRDTKGITYILPEVKSMQAVFPDYGPAPDDAAEPATPGSGVTPIRYRKSAASVEDHDPASIVH